MATNEEITSSLVAGNVPPDRECVTNLSSIIAGVQDFMSIQAGPGGDVTPPNNSIAEQALNTANTAIAQVAALTGQLKERRTLTPTPVPTGDSTFAFSWNPAMPSTDYDVLVTLYAGTTTHPAAYYGFRILESSITTTGVQVLFDNIPASTKAAVLVIQR